MKNNASLVYGLFLVVGDFLALVAAFVGAYILRVTLDSRPLIEAIPARTYLGVFLALLPFWIVIFGLLGLYNHSIYEKRFKEFGRLLIGSFIGLLFVISYDFVSKKTIFPARLVPVYGFVLAFSFLVIFRNLARYLRTVLFSYNIGINHVLIVGNTSRSEDLVNLLKDSRHTGYKIVGVVSSRPELIAQHPRLHVFPHFSEAVDFLRSRSLHSIIQTELYADADKNNEILTFAQEHHVAYRFVPGNTELFVGNIEVELFQTFPVIAVHQTALIGWGRVVKRLFDLAVSILMLAIALPFIMIIAILVKLTDPRGPVFFRQTRLTRFNHRFKVYKFRTLKGRLSGITPEQAFAKIGKPELSKIYRENGDFLPDDPRVTSFGKFLRKTSLDELPQLFNVLKGDISLVGPRALVPEELEHFPYRNRILSVKSGMSGLAQISGRRHISFEERRTLDMYYVQNWSFWLDLTIIFKTVGAVLRSRGAR